MRLPTTLQLLLLVSVHTPAHAIIAAAICGAKIHTDTARHASRQFAIIASVVSEDERAAAALVTSHLRDSVQKRVGLNSLLNSLPELEAFCCETRLRPAALLSLFPIEFRLEPLPSGDEFLSVRLPDGTPTDKAQAETVGTLTERLALTILDYHAQRRSTATDPVPLSWIVSELEAEVEAWTIISMTGLFHRDPARSAVMHSNV